MSRSWEDSGPNFVPADQRAGEVQPHRGPHDVAPLPRRATKPVDDIPVSAVVRMKAEGLD